MALDPASLSEQTLEFLSERHLATLTTLRKDGSPHVVLVGFTYDPDARLVRVITMDGSQKVRNIDRKPSAAVCQIAAPRWISFEGRARVAREPEAVAEAVRRYAGRYREPQPNPQRVAIEIAVGRIIGSG